MTHDFLFDIEQITSLKFENTTTPRCQPCQAKVHTTVGKLFPGTTGIAGGFFSASFVGSFGFPERRKVGRG